MLVEMDTMLVYRALAAGMTLLVPILLFLVPRTLLTIQRKVLQARVITRVLSSIRMPMQLTANLLQWGWDLET